MAIASRNEIQTANREFMAAFEKRDLGALGRLYTDDALVLPPNADLVRGTRAIGDFWRGMIEGGVTSVALDTVEVDEMSDVAVEVGRYRVMAGDALADQGKYLVVWKNQGGQWKLYRDIWNTSQPVAQ
jgi:ketosteroid isomerase-like protein